MTIGDAHSFHDSMGLARIRDVCMHTKPLADYTWYGHIGDGKAAGEEVCNTG